MNNIRFVPKVMPEDPGLPKKIKELYFPIQDKSFIDINLLLGDLVSLDKISFYEEHGATFNTFTEVINEEDSDSGKQELILHVIDSFTFKNKLIPGAIYKVAGIRYMIRDIYYNQKDINSLIENHPEISIVQFNLDDFIDKYFVEDMNPSLRDIFSMMLTHSLRNLNFLVFSLELIDDSNCKMEEE